MGVGASLIWWTLLAAPGAGDVDAALHRVLASGEYQTELPGQARTDSPPPRRPPDRPPVSRPTEPEPSRGDALRPVGQVVWWLFVAVFGAAVAAWLVREWSARRRGAAASASPAAAPRAAPARPAALPDHEVLARAGRHADAIHAILLSVLAVPGIGPAWTSREILRRMKLEEGPRRALGSLVGLVEVTRFGGLAAREEEYRRALGWLEAIGGKV